MEEAQVVECKKEDFRSEYPDLAEKIDQRSQDIAAVFFATCMDKWMNTLSKTWYNKGKFASSHSSPIKYEVMFPLEPIDETSPKYVQVNFLCNKVLFSWLSREFKFEWDAAARDWVMQWKAYDFEKNEFVEETIEVAKKTEVFVY